MVYNGIKWDRKDWHDVPLPQPDNWVTHPEWFTPDGSAKRIPGPRFVAQGDDNPWHWGPTESITEIGEYVILTFLEDRSTFPVSQQTDHGNKAFAVWVSGVKLDQVWLTLDEALVDMVRFKHEGPRGSSGPRATEYFMKMIGALDG